MMMANQGQPMGYMDQGMAMNGWMAAQRLQSLYTSMAHGSGCRCACCCQCGLMMNQQGPPPMMMHHHHHQQAGANFGMQAGMGVQGAGAVGFAAVFGMVGMVGSQAQAARVEDDPYGVAQSGQGKKSNLANSPEAMLALSEMLKDGTKTYEDVAKGLKDTYGIDAEAGDIKIKDSEGKETTVKGVKLGNGDYFIDGNGNGQLEQADYKFTDAVSAIKDKYQLKDEDITKITDRMKSQATQRNEWNDYMKKMNEGGAAVPPRLAGMNGPPGMMQTQGMDMNWMFMFVQAYQFAGVQ